jgi:hypothetical protein
MKTNRKEVLGSLTVVDNYKELHEIIVSQEIRLYYHGTTTHKKQFSLETVDGSEVYKTADPDIFKLGDGTILRKKSR